MLSLVEANAEMATANIEYRSDMFGRRGDAVLRHSRTAARSPVVTIGVMTSS